MRKRERERLQNELQEAAEYLAFLKKRRRDFAATCRTLEVLEGQCRGRLDDPKYDRGWKKDVGRPLLEAVKLLRREGGVVECLASEPDDDVAYWLAKVEELEADLAAS